MAITARDTCINALRLSGAVAGLQVPNEAEIVLALREMNNILSLWSMSAYWPTAQQIKNFAPTSVSSTITIGNGTIPSDLTAIAPFKIEQLYCKRDTVWYKLENEQRLNIDPAETQIVTGMPHEYSYQKETATQGTIYFDRTPDRIYEYKLVYDVDTLVYELDDELTYPLSHISCIEWNLAAVLGVHFGKIDESVNARAIAMLDKIKLQQAKIPKMETDWCNTDGRYDVYSDTFL